MLEKLIIIYSCIIILHTENKLYTRAILDLHGENLKEKQVAGSVTVATGNMETWQPIIKTKNWLAPPPNYPTPTSSSSSSSVSSLSGMTKSTTSIPSSLRIKLAEQIYKNPHQQQYFHKIQKYQQTSNYLPYNHFKGNYSNTFITDVKPQAPSSSSSSLSHVNNKITSNKLNQHYEIPTHHHHNHHQYYRYPLKNHQNLYPKIPKDIINEVQKPHMNSRILNLPLNQHSNMNAAEVNQHTKYLYHQQTQHSMEIPTTNTVDTLNVKFNTANNILTDDLNSFATNETLIDSKITNSITANTRRRSDYLHQANNDDDVVNLKENLLLLQKTFNNVLEFYDNVKDIILNDKDDNSDDGDFDDTNSIEDDIHDDNDLTMLNTTPDGAITAAPATAVSAATKEMPSLKIKKSITSSPFPATLVGEVQGRNRNIDKGTMKYSLTLSPAEVVVDSSSVSHNIQHYNEIHNVPAVAKATVDETTARAFQKVHSSSTSKSSLSMIGTGRKVKKIKKKLQKFLLPLVLAYKLKFLALIPLLVGGLTLLVGTTGLAGFFFALFTAVMSLKSGGRNSVIVKKY